MANPPQLRDVLFINLPQNLPQGSEQTGNRPAVVVGLPARLGQQRFPLLIVVPLTTRIGAWAQAAPRLYPFFPTGVGGLHYDSVALLDHLRGIDATRVRARMGRMSETEYEPIRQGLETMMRLK